MLTFSWLSFKINRWNKNQIILFLKPNIHSSVYKCICLMCSPVVLMSLIPKQIFSGINSSLCLYLLNSIKKWRKVAASIEREKSSARGLMAFMLMQHGMISFRSSSTLWGLDHFFIPLKATSTVWSISDLSEFKCRMSFLKGNRCFCWGRFFCQIIHVQPVCPSVSHCLEKMETDLGTWCHYEIKADLS